MPEMLLDRVGDAYLPPGYFLLTSEVEFLQHATGSQPLLVRGSDLVDWAEQFFQARGIPCAEVSSPTREIRALCPEMTAQTAQALLDELADAFFDLPRPLTLVRLLHELYPRKLWHEELPTARHAAEWLLWLHEVQPPAWSQPLLRLVCERWQEATPDPFALLYSATDPVMALRFLDGWLWIEPQQVSTDFGEFPQPVPSSLQERARAVWRERATTTRGSFFAELCSRPAPFVLKRLAAHEVAEYYRHQPQNMKEKHLRQLAEFLSDSELQVLRKRLAPPSPAPLPEQPEEVLAWFADSYLPYRLWQSSNTVLEAAKQVEDMARDFALWYLDHYPQALMGQSMRTLLSFAQIVAADTLDVVTLLVVLDGLHAGDARQLQQKIRANTSRLALVSDRLVFAPLPTVTEFCKPALFAGVPPARAAEVSPIGVVLPEDVTPVSALQHATPGQIYIWRIQEPDRTYHGHNGSATLLRDVEAQLDAAANKIVDLVNRVSDDRPLQIVIATDHGRLLAESTRRITVPPGMIGHGRAAWGNVRRSSDTSGYTVEDQVAFLCGERFGLVEDAAVRIGPDTFRTNDGRGGTEVYPHGGLFPEEVITPWTVFARDVEMPRLVVSIVGDGTAGKLGQLVLEVSNLGDVAVTVEALHLRFPAREVQTVPHEMQVAPRAIEQHPIDVQPWPSSDDTRQVRAYIRVRLPNGLPFEIEAQAAVRSQDMYDRAADILEGLDL